MKPSGTWGYYSPMLRGEKVLLRAMRSDDLERLCAFNNDLEVELSGGGDPPYPQSLERLQAEFQTKVSQGGRDGTGFAIEADGNYIGQCALFSFDATSQTCALGITIGDKDYWARGLDGMRSRLCSATPFKSSTSARSG